MLKNQLNHLIFYSRNYKESIKKCFLIGLAKWQSIFSIVFRKWLNLSCYCFKPISTRLFPANHKNVLFQIIKMYDKYKRKKWIVHFYKFKDVVDMLLFLKKCVKFYRFYFKFQSFFFGFKHTTLKDQKTLSTFTLFLEL